MTVNKIFSNLNKDNYIKDNQDSFNKFSSWTLSILSKINITKEAKTFLKLFYDSSQCTEKVLPNLSKITLSNLEMIFFSYKIFMNCLNSENSNYYKELISDKILNIINNNFIPGGESNENNWVNSVIEMEKFLLKENDQYKGAIYVHLDNGI